MRPADSATAAGGGVTPQTPAAVPAAILDDAQKMAAAVSEQEGRGYWITTLPSGERNLMAPDGSTFGLADALLYCARDPHTQEVRVIM